MFPVCRYIDQGRNPQLYTKECLERALAKNEQVKGKIDTMKVRLSWTEEDVRTDRNPDTAHLANRLDLVILFCTGENISCFVGFHS